MDVDSERLELIGAITMLLESDPAVKFRIHRTTHAEDALRDADYVITTFRVGGIDSRVIDERTAVELGFIGQETTGAGGFAMGMRSIPVLLGYVELMKRVCPNAWLINFANPSGMLAEAVASVGGWQRAVGICDGPSGMITTIANTLRVDENHLQAEYFGLNHLGWIRSVKVGGQELIGQILTFLSQAKSVPGYDIHPQVAVSLGMLPNYYLKYYYQSREEYALMRSATELRGEEVARMNHAFFKMVREARQTEDAEGLQRVYNRYLIERGRAHWGGDEALVKVDENTVRDAELGYARLALNLIEALVGGEPRTLIVNIPNRGCVSGMAEDAVVEIAARVSRDKVEGIPVGEIPIHCLGLMQTVKAYEQQTIDAAVEGSRAKAIHALTIHPLVADYQGAQALVDAYNRKHGKYYPELH
jgi:6-phospho-beta-glucosidase